MLQVVFKKECGRDLMIINDHINATPESIARVNDDRLGSRFLEMIEPYDREYINTVGYC